MARYVFDIETNGLLPELDRVHSLVIQDVDTGEMYSFGSAGGCDDGIRGGLLDLASAEQIIGHNIIGFDIPAIQKVYPWFSIDQSKVFDTLIMSRLIWGDLMDRDARPIMKGNLETRLRGSHGLEAWGQRLGEWKGDYSKIMKEKGLDPWANWNQDMQDYCEQDVRVNVKLLELIASKYGPGPFWKTEKSIVLEHRVAHIVKEQVDHGFLFDEEKALDLLAVLQAERAELETSLQSLFAPWYSRDGKDALTTPKRTITYKNLERHSVMQGAPYTKVKLNVFNPGSRAHVANRLQKVRGWIPTEFTANGQPKVDETVLSKLPYPEAKKIAYFFLIQKRLGQLFEGSNGWLKKINETTGRIHGQVNTNGAVTGRMTHNNPNVAQTPSVGSPYGAECRELWTVPEGKKLVGVDVSGLELRMLAHYMAPFDDGAYGREVVDGDIHTANQKAAGLSERNQAKTFIYAFLYGAGNAKIGSIVGKGANHGGVLKKRFLEQTPALNKLISGVTKAAKTRGYLKGLDGRILPIRHQHAALNTLLQSAGALVCKRWAVEMDDALTERGLKGRCQVVANIHDEHQYEVDAEIAEVVGELSVECIRKAGKYFGIRIPLDGEANIGNNWKETH